MYKRVDTCFDWGWLEDEAGYSKVDDIFETAPVKEIRII
jgi:hypothetical protein